MFFLLNLLFKLYIGMLCGVFLKLDKILLFICCVGEFGVIKLGNFVLILINFLYK